MSDIGKILMIAIQQADGGVDYNPRDGALCPFCGSRLLVRDTRPWDGGCRIRYHRCTNEACYLRGLEKSIKSVEEI